MKMDESIIAKTINKLLNDYIKMYLTKKILQIKLPYLDL